MAIWCELAPQAAEIIDEVPAGRIYKDGTLLIEADARTVADRRRLSFAGVVSVAIAITDKGEIAADPVVELIGIPERDREVTLIARTSSTTPSWTTLRRCRGRGGAIPTRSRKRCARAVRARGRRTLGQEADCHVHVLDGIDGEQSRETMIGRLNHVAIAVRDIAKATAVYRDTLGAEVSAPCRSPSTA